MTYQIDFRSKARKALLALPKGIRDNIECRLDALRDNPRAGDTKPLKGRLRGLMRLRVGDYRVLCLVDEDSRTIEVLPVGHREDFYS